MQSISIVGAGLTGTLLAIYLARRGHTITLYEKQSDLRLQPLGAGRSINLALSKRGMQALEKIGLLETVLSHAVPMIGRQVHLQKGKHFFQPYGVDATQCNYAMSRLTLNQILLDALDPLDNVSCFFQSQVCGFDLNTHSLLLNQFGLLHNHALEKDIVFATDGIHSPIRTSLEKNKHMIFEKKILDHAYKELTLSVAQAKGLKRKALHIWPRDDFMLIALPNKDGSFTCTLFLSLTGPLSFEILQDKPAIDAFFQTYFPDVFKRLPNVSEAFLNHPVGKLNSVSGGPWQVAGRVALLGDAAHAMAPFYGQGMNCAFEDVMCLDALMETHGNHWKKILSEFEKIRLPQAKAITQLSHDNYLEMRRGCADAEFQDNKKLERYLMQHFPEYYQSQYAMISFDTLPYTLALESGELQKITLEAIQKKLAKGSLLEALDLEKEMKRYARKLKTLKKECV